MEVLKTDIYDIAKITPLEKTTYFEKIYDNKIYLKREDLQKGCSFKIRGVYNKIKRLENIKKIMCVSTGNHAYAVALVCLELGYDSMAIMPKTTSLEIVNILENLNMTVILYGDNYDEAYIYSLQYKDIYNYIDSYDSHEVIVGNGTIGMEIINQLGSKIKNINGIFIPIGGGALLAGIALYIKELYPTIKIFGVGIKDSCSMDVSIKENKIIKIDKVNTFVNSVAINKVGVEAYEICKKYVDEIILVSEDDICGMIKQLYYEIKTIVEPACAMSMAGLIKYIDKEKSIHKEYIALLSGNNLEFDKLKYITERANIGDKSEIIIQLVLKEVPGSLIELLRYLNNDSMKDSLNISKFHYKYKYDENKESITNAKLYIGFSMGSDIGTKAMIELIEKKYEISVIDNTILHNYIPYLVGGIDKKLSDEYIFAITIPEKSGSLLNLLTIIENMINITLFHYRNNGETIGNIILGLQLINTTYVKFIDILKNISFISFTDETKNSLFS